MSVQREPGPGTRTGTRSGGVVSVADGSGTPAVPVVPALPPVLPWLRAAVWETAVRARRTAFQVVVLVLVLVLVLWVSVFLYGSFYFSFLPAASFSAPVHLVYPDPVLDPDPDPNRSRPRPTFPSANVSLLRSERDPVLVPGQPYRVSVDLELPESPVNRRVGMFVVVLTLRDRDGSEVAVSARSAMLRYRSGLLRAAATMLLLPALVAGVTEQKQLLEVELLEDFRPRPLQPPRLATLQVRDPRVQVYSARLRVHASFSGLRYLLYNFPLTAALVGVASNFLFLSLVLLLSYLQLTWGRLWPPDPDPGPVRVLMGDNSRIQKRTQEARRRREEHRKEHKTQEVQEVKEGKEEEVQVVQEEEVQEVKEEEVQEFQAEEVQEEKVQEVQEEEVQEKVPGPRVLGPVQEAAEPSEVFSPSRTPKTLRPREEVQNSEEDLDGPQDPQPTQTWTQVPEPVLRKRPGP